MHLTYLGHAGFILDDGKTRVLLDPWFFPAFLQSWFPYPDNRFMLPSVLEGKFDFLYISHRHQDHFDAKLLNQLNKSVAVLCPQYRSRAVGKRLASMGFTNLIPLCHKQSKQLTESLKVTMLLDTSHKEDSGLLFEANGFRFLALNDCNTSLTELPTQVDLLSAQYSGAMWYPNCYDYPAHVMKDKVAQVRSNLMDTLIRKCRATQTKAYIPSAGPACFLDPVLMQFNDRQSTIFPHWEDVWDKFAAACRETAVIPMEPGDSIDLPAMSVSHSLKIKSDDLLAYSDLRKEEWQEFYVDDEPRITADDIRDYFGRLQRRNEHLTKDIHKYIRVSAADQSWGINLGKMAEDFVIEGEDPYSPEYELKTPPRVLRAVLDGRVGWEEALLSMRLWLRRMPDVFDSRFMGLLRYGNEPIQTLQAVREAEGLETIEKNGIRLQRFCPHAGEDLRNAIICGHVIECPRHHWKWDSRTGQCIDGGSLPLRVERIFGTSYSEEGPIDSRVIDARVPGEKPRPAR